MRNVRLVLFVLFVALMSCMVTRTAWRHETRSWRSSYEENVLVNTEPQGAKVYCNGEYAGLSPVELHTIFDKKSVSVSQKGKYTVSWEESQTPLDTDSPEKRTSATNWGDLKFSLTIGAQWTIKAFKDGYNPATYTLYVTNGDNIFKQACQVLEAHDDDRLYGKPVGSRAILLALKPLQEPSPVQESEQQQQQQQQQTVVMPGGEQGKIGKVILTSNVENADVFVDSLFVGNTPANLKLKDGIHIIEVKKDGYKTYKRELRVLEGSETSLRVLLVKE